MKMPPSRSPSHATAPRGLRPVRPFRWALAAAALPILAVAACGGEDEAELEQVEPRTAEARAQLLPSPETAPEVPGAALRITSPADGDRFAEGDEVAVRFELAGFEVRVPTPTGDERGLARAPHGQHVHLVVNDRPYQAIYDLDEPVVLDDLPAGTHVIRAFPGRDWHESVKEPAAFDQVVIVVGDDEIDTFVGPSLVYSRPQGLYEGVEADSILVDFFAHGIELGDGAYQVLFTLNNDQTFRIAEWRPWLLVGLGKGEHVLRMELFDELGERVETPFLPVERRFEVRR